MIKKIGEKKHDFTSDIVKDYIIEEKDIRLSKIKDMLVHGKIYWFIRYNHKRAAHVYITDTSTL